MYPECEELYGRNRHENQMKELLCLFRHFLQAKIESMLEALVHTDLCSKQIQTMVFSIKSRSPLHEVGSHKMLGVPDTPLIAWHCSDPWSRNIFFCFWSVYCPEKGVIYFRKWSEFKQTNKQKPGKQFSGERVRTSNKEIWTRKKTLGLLAIPVK